MNKNDVNLFKLLYTGSLMLTFLSRMQNRPNQSVGEKNKRAKKRKQAKKSRRQNAKRKGK